MVTLPAARRVGRALVLASLGCTLASIPREAQIGAGVSTRPAGTGVLGEGHIGGLPGSMTRSVEGEWTGDLRPDAAVLVGNRPVFLFNAGLHHALTDLPATGTEMGNWKGGAPGGLDALLLSSARGLEAWWLVPATQGFAMQALGGSDWVHARRLRSGDLLGDGQQGIVGIRDDGSGAVLLPSPLDPSSEVSIDTPYTIFDLDLVQWDGVAGLELALLTSEGLKITDRDLNPLQTYPYGDDSDRLCVVRQPGLGHDRVAVVVELGANHWLYCVDRDQLDPGLLLGNVDMVDMVSADFDADGQHDLILSHKSSGELALFYNRRTQTGASFSLDPGSLELIDLTPDGSGPSPAPWNEGVPLFCDLDADGDADVLHPMNKDHSVVLYRSAARDHRAYVPAPVSGCYQYDPDDGSTRITLELQAPAQELFVADLLEVVVWRQADPSAPTDPLPLSVAVVPLATWPLEVELETVELLPSPALFHVQLRLARLGAQGGMRTAGPSYVHALTASLDSAEEAVELHGVDPGEVLLLGRSDLGEPCEEPKQNLFQGGQPAGTTPTGRGTVGTRGGYIPFSGDEGASGVPLTCVPCFTDGWIPWGI